MPTLHSFSFNTPSNCASIEHVGSESLCSCWVTLALLLRRVWFVRYQLWKGAFFIPYFPFELLNITSACLLQPLQSSRDSEIWSTNTFVLLFFILFFI